jgi:hypothetical protein
VRFIGYSAHWGGALPKIEGLLTVDVLNYGASISDLEVWIEILIPPLADKSGVFRGPHSISLLPVGRYINPLGSGQAAEFVLKNSRMNSMPPPPASGASDMVHAYAQVLKNVPRRHISLCIYSNGKRQRLRRIRSRTFHWHFDNFFGRVMKVKPPLRLRIYFSLFKWSKDNDAKRIRAWVDKWRPGYFDFWFGRFSDWFCLSDSPDHFRPQPPPPERPAHPIFQ